MAFNFQMVCQNGRNFKSYVYVRISNGLHRNGLPNGHNFEFYVQVQTKKMDHSKSEPFRNPISVGAGIPNTFRIPKVGVLSVLFSNGVGFSNG